MLLPLRLQAESLSSDLNNLCVIGTKAVRFSSLKASGFEYYYILILININSEYCVQVIKIECF